MSDTSSRFRILTLVALASCQSRGSVDGTSVEEPWQSSRKGNFGISADLGVASGYEVSSRIEVLNPNFPVEPTPLDGDLKGAFGGGLGVEYFVFDDLALLAGAEARVFDPELEDDVFEFGRISQFEYFIGARYLFPVRWLKSEKLRPYLQMKAAYVPSVEFDMTTRFALPDPLEDISLFSPFRGSSYWTLGVGGGLAYEFQSNLVGRLGFFYEWALAESGDVVPTERTNSTGDAALDEFLDGIFAELMLDVTLNPRGWIAFAGITYYL